MSVYLEGAIYGPLTQREASLVERTYMGALLAKEILASCDWRHDEFLPVRAGEATHDEGQGVNEHEWKHIDYWEMRRRDKEAGAKDA